MAVNPQSPCQVNRQALVPVPSVAMPPLPFWPLRFSAEIERDFAFDNRHNDPTPDPMLLKSM